MLYSMIIVKEDVKKEFNEDEGTQYPNLWYTMKGLIRGRFIALSGSKSKP